MKQPLCLTCHRKKTGECSCHFCVEKGKPQENRDCVKCGLDYSPKRMKTVQKSCQHYLEAQ